MTGTVNTITQLFHRTEQAFVEHKNQIIVYVVLGTLAALAFSISAWANINIAYVYGTSAILKHSVYTILLPLAVTVLAVRLITFLFRPLGSVTTPPKADINLNSITVDPPVPTEGETVLENDDLKNDRSTSPKIAEKPIKHLAPIETTSSPTENEILKNEVLAFDGDSFYLIAAPTIIQSMPYPGQVLSIHVKPGDLVRAGDPLFTIETMKVNMIICADIPVEEKYPIDGIVEAQRRLKVTHVLASPQQVMERGAPVLHCEEIRE